MNIPHAQEMNQKKRCAGCGVIGEPLRKVFWKVYDFKYCQDCAMRRAKGIAPDWTREVSKAKL